MNRYETLILASPDITADEMGQLERLFEQEVKKMKGAVISFERWGKYKLAYPVRRNDYGVYFLSRFEFNDAASQDLAKELRTFFNVKFPQVVMRHMIHKLVAGQSLAYTKPESLEDIPSQDVDTFLRENKMEGLLKTSSASPKRSVSTDRQVDNSVEDSQEVDNG